MRVAQPAGLCLCLAMDELQPYTLGYAPDGTRCAYLGDAVDARDFIFEGVVFMFTYDRRWSLDVCVGVVKSIDHTGVLFGAIDGEMQSKLRHEFGDTVFVEWKRLLKIREEMVLEDLKSPWQDCGGRSMNVLDFLADA